MLKEGLLDSLYAKRQSPAEFNFETLQAPSMYNFLSEYDLAKIYDITTSIKYSSKVDEKIKAIKDILAPRGFVQFANGTNRMCFRYLEDKSFVLKVAYKKSGLDNGYREFCNQQLLKPFVAKTFEVHPSGIASMHERVLPITSREEFLSIADDAFELLTTLNGKYVLDDAGSEYFMNLGIRSGFGVVIIDYVDLYELDGKKLFCNRPLIPNTKFPLCGGIIDFDDGFNHLVCTKCGKEYSGSDLQKAREDKLIIIEGDTAPMKVRLMKNGQVIAVSDDITDTIVRPEEKHVKKRPSNTVGRIIRHVAPPDPTSFTEPESVNIVESKQEQSIKKEKPIQTAEPATKKNPAKIDLKLSRKNDGPTENQKKIANAIAANTNHMVEEKEREQTDLITRYAEKYDLNIYDLNLINQILLGQGHNYTIMDLPEDQLDKLFSSMAKKKNNVDSARNVLADNSNTLQTEKQEDKSDEPTKSKCVPNLGSKFIPSGNLDNY